MLNIRKNQRRRSLLVEDARVKMIRETNAFLTWALSRDRGLPRIPRRRVTDGGFSELLRRPGAVGAVEHWWKRTLELVGVEW